MLVQTTVTTWKRPGHQKVANIRKVTKTTTKFADKLDMMLADDKLRKLISYAVY